MDNSEYQVIILAAGRSRRLAELTTDKPKSFLNIGGKRIIDHHLEILYHSGFQKVTMVVGYLRDLFFQTVGRCYKDLAIEYVIAEEFASTGHAWSVYLAGTVRQAEKRPVLLIHADVFYDPRLLDKVLHSPSENVILVDNKFTVQTGDECVVRGQQGQVSSILFDSKQMPEEIIGEFVGINKWSPSFFGGFCSKLQQFFVRAGRNVSYEVVLNEFLQQEKRPLHYLTTDGLPWININYKEDYYRAQDELFPRIYGRNSG